MSEQPRASDNSPPSFRFSRPPTHLSLSLCSDALQEKESRKSFIMSEEAMAPRGKLVFFVGLGALLFVPVFKSLTGLPPYLGMLLGLGVLWVLTGKCAPPAKLSLDKKSCPFGVFSRQGVL